MFPSAMSFTVASSPTSSPSSALVFVHFALWNDGSFLSASSRSRFHFSVFSGFIIVGIGIDAPAAITVLLSRAPVSLHVVAVEPITAASFPSIFTFALVPPVTSPSFFGLCWNFIVPGSCMCVASSCLATLPFIAHFLFPSLTSFASLSFSFPMNGCGSGTSAVPVPDGTVMTCTSNPSTLSPSAATCFPSALTPRLPCSRTFLPLTFTSLPPSTAIWLSTTTPTP
ncbi:MAG: hypothetical protein HDR36_05535 [Treponema sp.]|nr:hypothetical protein [Treponema sp.]